MMTHRRSAALLMIVLALLIGSGCALSKAQVPDPGTDAAHLAEMTKLAHTAKAITQTARAAQDFEISLYRLGNIPADAHVKVQRAFLVFFTSAEASLAVASDVTKPAQARRDAALSVARNARALTAELKIGGPDLQTTLIAIELLADLLL